MRETAGDTATATLAELQPVDVTQHVTWVYTLFRAAESSRGLASALVVLRDPWDGAKANPWTRLWGAELCAGGCESAAGDCRCPRSIGRSFVSVKVQCVLMPGKPTTDAILTMCISLQKGHETSHLPSTNCAGNLGSAPSSIVVFKGVEIR